MRFGRRNKSRLIPMRSDVSAPLSDGLGPVVSEERSALLAGHGDGEATEAVEDLPFSAGDPTQRLVTALGRFHRYVAKGQSGASQEYWSDDCMDQLGLAIEIALSQDWMNIVEALTDVARILQSYENVGTAHLCVSFLNESYEILSLMVGDLIVNNVRSGVMDKWRERYRRAVADLSAAGLTLVQDQDSEEEPAEVPPEGRVIPFDTGAPAKSDTPKPPPEEDSFLPFMEITEEEAAEELPPPEYVPVSVEEEAASPVPVYESAATEPAREAVPVPVFEPVPEPSAVVAEEAPVASPPVPAEEGASAAGLREDLVAVSALDALSTELGRLDKSLAAGSAVRLDFVRKQVATLERRADEQGYAASSALCGLMAALCERTEQDAQSSYEHFLDMAYAFCEAYVDASTAAESVSVTTWRADVEDMLRPRPAVAAPVPIAEVAPDGAPESLLETAQLAVARGDMSSAKAWALQAVAQLARTEAAKAEARVQEAEQRLRQSSEAIDKARLQVKKAEQDVTVAENRVSGGESELAELRSQTVTCTEHLNAVERRIADIDEQIRALQAARVLEESNSAKASTNLEEARDAEQRGGTELRALQEAEDAARVHLEDARQQVKDQQRKRQECEAALTRGRETLTKHRASLADIERTVSQLGEGEATGGAESNEMLF